MINLISLAQKDIENLIFTNIFVGRESAIAQIIYETNKDKFPMVNDKSELQIRILCACAKISNGCTDRFEYSIASAMNDWRDVLVEAGFAEDQFAHILWLESRIK